MRIYNRYVISLVLSACLINTALAFWGEDDLEVYFIINTIAYLAITLLYVYFNRSARKTLSIAGGVLFAGFMVILALKVMEIVSRLSWK